MAVQSGNLETVQFVWEANGAAAFSDEACWMAAGGGNLAVLKWLRSQGQRWTPHTILPAYHEGYWNVVGWILNHDDGTQRRELEKVYPKPLGRWQDRAEPDWLRRWRNF